MAETNDIDLVAEFDIQGFPAPLSKDRAGTCVECGRQAWFLLQSEGWSAHFCSDECALRRREDMDLGAWVANKPLERQSHAVSVRNKTRSRSKPVLVLSTSEEDF